MPDTTTPTAPVDQYAGLRAIAERATARPLMVSDCDGEIHVWAEHALKHVVRNDDGQITGYSFPGSYRACDNVISFDLDGGTWDPGEDPDDDQRRADINDLVDARAALKPLLDRIAELEQQVAEQALTGGERVMLRFALEMADDAISSTPADFTAEDTAAMDKLRGLATGPTVAYRNPWRPGVLLCREHGEGWSGMQPLSAEDLPNGGTCTAGDPAVPDDVCGRDVLAGSADQNGA